ncbi:MAG TPA: PDZ domain-containing protein [Anaerolineales bacterium]|nr:PDZ domain-containing protein [Anaerolineales bacterium]
MANSTPRRSTKANPTPPVKAEASPDAMTATRYSTWQVIGIVVVALAVVAVACGAGLTIGFGAGRASRAMVPLWSDDAGVMPHMPYGQQGMPWYGPMPYGGQMPYHDQMPYYEHMPFLEESQPALPATAYLGIAYEPADEGAAVGQVLDGSPAERAGLRVGDVITAVDGIQLVGPGQLRRLIQAHQPGDKVTLTILRGEDKQTVVVTLGSAPATP